MLTGYRRRQDHDDRVRNHRFLARRQAAMATLGASTALVLGAAACGGGGSTGSTSATTRAPANRAAASGGSARQVMTQLTEFKISLSQQGFTPGGYTFVV